MKQNETAQDTILSNNVNQPVLYEEDVVIKNRRTTCKVHEIIRNSILLALSILLFVMAFLPVGKMEISKEENVYLQLRPIDFIVFLMDSCENLDEKEIEATKLYDSIEEDAEELDSTFLEDGENLTREEKNQMTRMTRNLIRLSLKSEDVTTKVYMVLGMLAAIVYIAVAMAFLIVSALHFSFWFFGKRSLLQIALNLLAFLPVSVMANICLIDLYECDQIGVAPIISLACCIVFFLYLLVDRIIRQHRNIRVSRMILNAVSFALATATLLFVFTPVFKTDIKTVFFGKEERSTVSTYIMPPYFAQLELDDADAFYEENIIQNLFEEFRFYKRNAVRNGEADDHNETFLTYVAMDILEKKENIRWFSLLYYATLLAVIGATVIAMQNMLYLATRKKQRWLVIVSKCLCVAAVLIVLGLAIGFMVISNLSLDDIGLDRVYSVSLGVGPIALTIAAVATACIPSGDKIVIYQEKSQEDIHTAE